MDNQTQSLMSNVVELDHIQFEKLTERYANYVRGFTSGTHMIFSSTETDPAIVMDFLAKNNITFKVLLGSYKGVLETSYLVSAVHLEEIANSDMLTYEESILITGNMQKNGLREAFLVFNDLNEEGNPRIENLGLLDVLKPEETLTLDAWSFDPTIGAYFGVRAA